MTYTAWLDGVAMRHSAPDDHSAAKWMANRFWRDSKGYVCIDGKHHDDLQRFIRRNA